MPLGWISCFITQWHAAKGFSESFHLKRYFNKLQAIDPGEGCYKCPSPPCVSFCEDSTTRCMSFLEDKDWDRKKEGFS